MHSTDTLDVELQIVSYGNFNCNDFYKDSYWTISIGK